MKLRKIAAASIVALLMGACAQTVEETAQAPPAAPPTPPPASKALEAEIVRARSEAARLHHAERYAATAAAPDAIDHGSSAAAHDPLGPGRYTHFPQNRENYGHFEDGAVLRVLEAPVSTFSIDVDTGAYANVRRLLREGALPPQDAVRVEEFVNYFDYAYPPPPSPKEPFAVHTELAPTPWNTKTHLLRIGLQGWLPPGELPPANLVFLVDVSGSMQDERKLPLVKSALKLLTQQLSARDRISLVVYAGNTGVVLEPTSGDRKATIMQALERLEAGGSTNGADGIRLAYAMAEQGFIVGGINRVLLATDGDFNVGTVNFEQLKDLVEDKRKSGVALSTLGFGTGNYNDHLMEQLADAGNGNYTYVDGLDEARRALVASRAGLLQTIASDVKIQVEFNPAAVAEYRLIGYENRALRREDFNNDQVDAGDIGAGHSVTALYEIALAGSGGERNEPLRYRANTSATSGRGELAFLRMRYKTPEQYASQLIERPITRAEIRPTLAAASESLRFAAAVAAFGQLLRGGRYTEAYDYNRLLQLAREARGADRHGWKGEFIQLVELSQSLSTAAANRNCPPEHDCG